MGKNQDQHISKIACRASGWHIYFRPAQVYLSRPPSQRAAVSILINRYADLSGLMLGIMFFLFVALMDLPGTLKSPGNRIFWTLTFRELAFGGAAWALAGTRALAWRYSGVLRTTGRIVVAVPTLFFAVQYLLHPASAHGSH